MIFEYRNSTPNFMIPEENANYCKNCFHPHEENDDYCNQCGQKTRDSKISFWALLKEFLADTFSLDSRIFRSLNPLFLSPGKLTTEYFKGKRKQYVSPIRLFLFSTLIFLGIFFFFISSNIVNIGNQEIRLKEELASDKEHNQLISELDTAILDLKSLHPNKQLHQDIDTLFKGFQVIEEDSFDLDFVLFGKPMIMKFPQSDFAKYTPKEIVQNQEVEGWFNQWISEKVIRLALNGDAFGEFVTARISWMIFLSLPLFALVLKLLYIRRKRYYVEHLIFGFHFHSFAFLLLGLYLTLMRWLPSWFSAAAPIAIVIYLLLAMKKYYGQGKRKTFFKYLLMLFSYVFVFTITFLIFLFINLALY